SAARDALSARWNELNNVIMGLPEPSADSGEPVVPPDPMPAANKLARAKPSPQTQRMKDAFISAMVDQAWLELYYAHKPQDAGRWTDALKVVAAGSPQLERLEGWYDLQTQKFEEAAQHFNAIKGTDVLAELGLIAVARSEATPKTLERARELKEKLLATHFDGLLDSIVHQALVPAAAAALPANLPGPPGPANAAAPTTGPFAQPAASADAQAMTAALKQFPMEVLSFSRQPEKFYGLHFTPLSTSCRYGQPIMATVSIVNTGDIDLPIDALGPLVPMFMYDGDAMGANSPPSRAIDELMGRLVLRPNEEVDQIVRLDQGALLYYLQQSISPGLTLISGDVYSNAVMGSTKVAAGPGGLRAGTSQLIGRQVPDLLNSGGRTQFYQDLQAGAADVRIDSLDLLWANGRWLHKRTQNEGDVQLAKEFLTVIDHYQTDPVSVVADWAKYRAATLPRPDGEKLIHALMTDKHWLARLLSLMAMQNEPYVIRRNMTAAMTKDSDATVKALADSTLNRLTVAATQPATQPDDLTGAATQPTLLPERP
ncbi:MAG TPA: hypothetical protein VHY37_00075, partial [Tepidisphaeraceae bacterium]|nr:hypothetical protein [Tepidisphaeraceae bacterium]